MLTLNTLKSPRGANKNTKRLGRGPGSGQGCQAGKGHKGHKARSGGGVRFGFEGGNLPMYMRLPKMRQFTNSPFKVKYAIVDLSVVETHFNAKSNVTKEALIEKGILKGHKKHLPVKILSKNNVCNKELVFVGIDKFSKSAHDLVIKSGGHIEDTAK